MMVLKNSLDRRLHNTNYHDTLDIVIDNHGTVSIEDNGVCGMCIGEVIDFQNHNVNALA